MIKKTFAYCIDLLNDIVFNDIPFAIATKKHLKNSKMSLEDKKIISALVGCELRHHLVFNEIMKNYFEELEAELSNVILFALANNLFIKHFNDEEVIDYVHSLFVSKLKGFTREEIKEFFNKCSDTSKLIPEKYKENSKEFLSLRFNTPAWLIKMWKNSFGENLTYKILKANTKAPLNTVRVNTNLISTEEVLQKENVYKKSFLDDVVIYQGKLPFNKQKYLESNKVFPLKLGYKYLTNKLDIDSQKGVAIYQGTSSNFYLEVALRGGFNMPIDLLLESYQDYYLAKSNIKNFNISNLRFYHCEPTSIFSCVSKKVDLFFVLPKSSNFELLRNTPDYFLRFDRFTFDTLIKNQYFALEECSKLIEDDGKLVYIIPTLSVKEGRGNIALFLQNHKDFTLVEDRQLFPFDPYDSSLYYAILRKVPSNND